MQRRVFPLIRLTAEAIAEARNPNISDMFELYCSLSDRKERGSFTFSASGSSHFKSKLLDRARDDMVCVPLQKMRKVEEYRLNYHRQVSQLLFVRLAVLQNAELVSEIVQNG